MMRDTFRRLRDFFPLESLRVQLLSRTLLILAALLILVGLLQYVLMKDVVYKSEASSLQSQARSIPPIAWERMEGDKQDKEEQPSFFFSPEASLAFIDWDGNYTILSDGHQDVAPPRLATEQYEKALKRRLELNYSIVKNDEGTEQLVVLQPTVSKSGNIIGVIQISAPTAPMKELLLRQLATFIVLSLLAMLLGLFGYLPVLRKTLVPLFNMVETAEQIDAGNLAQRFPTAQRQEEIDRLAASFNGMLERLEASFKAEQETKEQMRRFVADASHELRTPLTSIHGFLEILLRGAANKPEQLNRALQSMHSESERLNKLVQNLLLLARLDRTPHLELLTGDLGEMLGEMEPQLRILAGDRQVDMEIKEKIICKYDRDQLKQVVLNLFHNAVQHTDSKEGCIRIILTEEKNCVQLAVSDNGPGIGSEHLPHVFERFYRSDSSRTRKYGGAGLGLSITKAIVDAHGGTIHVTSEEGKSSNFYVQLPKEPNGLGFS